MQGKVKAGISTLSLGGVSAAAYVAAVVAFFNGARDEVTIGTAVIGTVALVTMAAGRFWQAVAQLKKPTPTAGVTSAGLMRDYQIRTEAGSMVPGAGTTFSGTSGTTPRPHAQVTATPVYENDVMRDNALDPEPPAGPDKSLANPTLDDPAFAGVPTAAEHSRLKG